MTVFGSEEKCSFNINKYLTQPISVTFFLIQLSNNTIFLISNHMVNVLICKFCRHINISMNHLDILIILRGQNKSHQQTLLFHQFTQSGLALFMPLATCSQAAPPPLPNSGIFTPVDNKFGKVHTSGFSGLRAVKESSVGGHIFVKSKILTRFPSNFHDGGSTKNQLTFVSLLL